MLLNRVVPHTRGIGSGWDWDNFPLHSLLTAVLCSGSWTGVGNTAAFWVLLRSAGTAPAVSATFHPCQEPGSGSQLGQVTWTDQRGILYSMTSAWIWKLMKGGEKGGIHYLECLLSTTCIEDLIPGKWADITCWWEIENKMFGIFPLFVCVQPFTSAFIHCLISVYKLFYTWFSLPLQLRRGTNRAALWAWGAWQAAWCPNKVNPPQQETVFFLKSPWLRICLKYTR